MIIKEEETEQLVNVLRSRLREAKTGLYAEPKWARSIEVQLFIIEEWCRRHLPEVSQDGPAWTVEEMRRGIIERALPE